MAEEESDFSLYRNISELKKGFQGIKVKKDVSTKELNDSIQKLNQLITDMLELFGAAAEQLKLEDKEFQSDTKRHELMLSKLDKIIEENKTIAEAMVSLADMVKEKMPTQKEEEKVESLFKPQAVPSTFMKPQQEWQPSSESTIPPTMPKTEPEIAVPLQQPNFGMVMPPMQPAPLPELDFLEETESLEEQPKKGLFRMFKK